MSVIISLSNQKGGVGKTTVAINLGAALAESGAKTLLIDLDPQSSLTAAMGQNPNDVTNGTYALLDKGKADILEMGNLALMPTNSDLAAANIKLSNKVNPNVVLKASLAQYAKEFDYILIDCPPGLERLTLNALFASRWVIIPTQCQYMSLNGLALFLSTFEEVQQATEELEIFAVLPNMFDARRSHEKEALEILQSQFGEKCLEPVPDRTEYPTASAQHRPVGNGQAVYWQELAQKIRNEAHNG